MSRHSTRVAATALLLLLLLAPRALAAYRVNVDSDDLCPAQDLDASIVNVLLIGTDTRQDVANAARSDTMMICSIDGEGRLRLSSLARDMWVTIPGMSGHHKLNAAHSYGGPNLLMKTINQLFHMNLTRYLSVNFYGLSELIDWIGGVSVPLTAAEVSVINRSAGDTYGSSAPAPLASGAQTATLNGAQALAYARIRYLDSDFGRTARQRRLLGSALEKVRGFSLAEQAQLFVKALSCVSTNLTPLELLRLGRAVMQGETPPEELSLPADFSYDSGGGVSKVLFDAGETTRLLHEFIYGEP